MTGRILIIGQPRTGKTTLAHKIASDKGLCVYSTDDLIGHMAWSEASDFIADNWLCMPGPWIIEGVGAIRGIRKYIANHPNKPCCDQVIILNQPMVPRTLKQDAMAKGCDTIWLDCVEVVKTWGVPITSDYS